MSLSSDAAESYLQGLRQTGQFAVFQLPKRTAFVQVIRTSNASLVIEVGGDTGAVEPFLQRLGRVSRNELGFLTVSSEPGHDAACAQVIAEAIGALATAIGCQNVCRVRTGAQ